MSDLTLNSDWDFQIENADLKIIEDKQALVQFLKQRIQLFFGEWFLDSSLGVPYYQEVLVKSPGRDAVDAVFKKVILETPGIVELQSFEFDYNNATRTLNVSFRARSTEGVIDFNEVIEI